MNLCMVLQALCLSDLIPWIYLSLPLYNHIYLNGLMVFPMFFGLSLDLAMSSWSEEQSAPGLVFADCTELLHLCLQRLESVWFPCWSSGDTHVQSLVLEEGVAVARAFSWWNSLPFPCFLFFSLRDHTCSLLQMSLDSCFCIPVPCDEKGTWCSVWIMLANIIPIRFT